MKNIKLIVGCILGLALLVSAFLFGQKCAKMPPVEPVKVKVDTLYIHDTITIKKPVSVTKRVIDTMLLAVTDTIMAHDTMYVALERQQVVWQDSLAVVYASGVMPSVDSVQHFTQERIVTIEEMVPYKVKSRWGLGVHAGYGAAITGNQVKLAPYIGVGVSYNIISW